MQLPDNRFQRKMGAPGGLKFSPCTALPMPNALLKLKSNGFPAAGGERRFFPAAAVKTAILAFNDRKVGTLEQQNPGLEQKTARR